jgi:sigma-B regulation protein RsbU (phosphoserine phosphatase)
MMLLMYFVIGPLRKVQKNIRLYKDTKDSASVIKNLSTINSRNEIGQLATDTIDLAKEIKDYTDQIETNTAEKERIVTELSLAKRIQEAMLPNDFPAFPDRDDFDIYASMDPAKEVGGDFYDFLMIDEDHLYIAIADVSGKGVPAALFMMASRIVLANNAMMGKNPARILEDTNESICRHNKEEMFITVWLGILELSTGILTAANAGHEYPVIMQKGGRFEMLKDKHGFVVGGMENMKYDNYEIRMTRGTKLFLHTDGLTEATNEDQEMFGEARVIASLNTVSGQSPKQILKKVTSDVDNFVKEAEQFDDLTMLCLEYRGPEDPENQGMSESSLEGEGQG